MDPEHRHPRAPDERALRPGHSAVPRRTRPPDHGNARLVRLDGYGHTTSSTCTRELGDAYLIDLTLPAPGITCPADRAPSPDHREGTGGNGRETAATSTPPCVTSCVRAFRGRGCSLGRGNRRS
ncbi:alpha/beta hydrolase [Nocardia sp. CC201C]|uniref:alpha/beta hydrolase n=1 Tax=Nocardia sp. CC201C TaxID=3044575 RepID=UPI0024A7BD53|nr:alpha/beta hydrolase [Nocardia sp. CC201C]